MNHPVRCPGCNRILGAMRQEQFIYVHVDVVRPSLPCPMRCRCGAELIVEVGGQAVYSGHEPAHVGSKLGKRTVERPDKVGV